MAFVLKDRVRDTTTTTGTGTVTLAGSPPTGFQAFSAVGNGNTTYYAISLGADWETGIGTYSSTGPTLARTTVLASSNGGALVNFSAGTKDVFTTLPAQKLSEAVSVKDYGAVGNDTANDTAAFVAAAASGLPVVIPAGIYRVAGVTYTQRVTFMPGAQVRRTSGTLAFNGGIEAPCQQIFLDAVHPNVGVNNTLTPEGWVDWFGYDQDAIETCHKIFSINRLGPRDYYANRTVLFNQSYREVIGSAGSAEGAGGTRIILIGSAAVNQPVVQVGTLNTSSVAACARRLNIRDINTVRDGVVAPAASDRREDATPGWKVAGWYEGRMENCFDYGSPIHHRVYATVACTLVNCFGVRPTGGSANGHPDYYTGMCIGGYAPSFGFVGANASLTIDNCGSAGGVGAARMGVFLFGYISDTWIRKTETSQLEYGVFVDGSDASGATITTLTAHQNVRLRECVIDAATFNGITLKNLNAGSSISVEDNYCAVNAAGDGLLINNCAGMVAINSGTVLGNPGLAIYGIRAVASKHVYVSPAVSIKDCRVGVRAESSERVRLLPTITRTASGGTNAVEIAGVGRSYIAPAIDGAASSFDYGIASDSASNFSEYNLSGINPDCFSTVSAGRKIWHDGASWGGGGTFGNNNIATGVLN